MTTVGARDQGIDSGYAAILGHRLLGSAAVVRGALDTLAGRDTTISSSQRALLLSTIDANLDAIAEIARALATGEEP